MSRRGGKRRQVLQLGESTSKLHRYGYSKGFQTVESSVQSNALSALVGDYSDSDSDDNGNSNSGDHQTAVNQIPDKDEQHENTPPPAVPEPSTNGQNGGKEDAMDDELRNFLSEIEAIPMPDHSKTPDNLSEGVPSPAPIGQAAGQEMAQGEATIEDTSSSSKTVAAGSTKKKSAYSMFVKGDVEFAGSPVPEQAVEDCQEKAKAVDDSTTDINVMDIPEKPTSRWQMVQDETTQYYYYWNWQTNEVTWEIPSDYTQYLLLHKEYQEKMAKIPPHVLQAWKDKNAGKDKDTNDSNSNENAKTISSVGTSAKIYPERKEEVDDEGHIHHHHKKKKSKKHKRKRNSSSDDDLDDKYLREDSTSVKSSSKSKKTKPTIGPQPLSIVPYMSDDNEEDSCNDNNEEDKKREKEIVTNSVSVSESSVVPESKKDKSKSQSTSPVPLSKPKDLEDMETDFDSLVQNLVEFHDNMTLPGRRGEIGDIDNSEREAENVTKETVVVKSEIASEIHDNMEGVLNKQMDVDEKDEGSAQVDAIKQEIEVENDLKVPEEQGNELPSKEKERQNIFDQFSVIKESEKTKKKKKVINMFAEDSQSEVDENIDDGAKEVSGAAVKLEVEEGEISDSSETLRNVVDAEGTHCKKGRKANSDIASKQKVQSSEKSASSFKSVVGYSEEKEKEEGELKEGEVTQLVRVEVKEEIDDGVVSQPKKKVLQYKDYMKKYRSDRNTSNSNSVEACEKESSKETVQEKDVQEEQNLQKDKEAVVEPVVCSQVEENNIQKEGGEEDKKLEGGGNEDEDSEEIDFDDLDDIDRVLEKALEKKREHKTESKPETDGKTNDVPETSHVSPSSSSTVETKQTEVVETERAEVVEPSVDGSGMSDTDMKRLKYAVKDSAELALNKLQFLDISTKNLSKLQTLLVELQTRYSDWQSGGLSTPYFHKQLKSSEALLSQYEESAVPSGWSCQWDRASCRYFYRNVHSGHTQWEYPQVVVGMEPASTTTSSKGGEVKDSSSSRGRSSKKRRSKDVEERGEESSKTRGHTTSSRSSRSHRSSKKSSEKDRGKRDRHSSSSHHHRKKKRRRREHNSSTSSSSEDEDGHSSRHRHRSKRKKRGRSDKSPSLEVIDCDGPDDNVQIIEDSPPPSVVPDDSNEGRNVNDGGEGTAASPRPVSAMLGLIADYGSEQDIDDEENEDADEGRVQSRGHGNCDNGRLTKANLDDVSALERRKREMEEELEGIDGEEMEKEEAEGMQEDDEGVKEEVEPEEEEDMNSAVIVKPPQIIVPPSYVAAMNQPQLYSALALYTSAHAASSATTVAPPMSAQEHEQGETTTSSAVTCASQASEENDKGASRKKKKDKSGKEKSLTSNSSIMMKKKRVSSMVQKWQQVKKEVEKENRDKEMRQAAIREKINQLKST